MDIQKLISIAQEIKAQETAQPTPDETTQAKLDAVIETLKTSQKATIEFLKSYKPNIDIPTSVSTPDVKEVVTAVKELKTALKPVGNDNSDIIKGLANVANTVKSELQATNRAVTNSKSDRVEVSNLQEISSKLDSLAGTVDALAKAIKGLELAPKITVPKPTVEIQATDVTSVVKGLKEVTKAVTNKPIPVANVPTDPLIYYTPADIDDAGAVQYFGYTDNRGAWYIRKFDTSASPKTIRFCFGQSNYATNFTNRASLTYATWGS